MNRWMAGSSFRALMAPDGPTSGTADPAVSAASAAAPPSSSSAAEASVAGTAPKAAESSAPSSTGDAAKPSDGAAAKPESAPSLLASADAGKRDGAPKSETPTEPAKTPPPADAKAPETVDGKAPEAKPEDGKDKPKDGADAAAKDAPAEPPPAPPVYEAPKLPEGQKLDDKLLSAFDKKVGEFQLAHKVDHAAMQSFRQEMINDYVAEVQRIGQDVAKFQREVWNRTIETRISELKADPELGGSRLETVLGNGKYVIESFGGLTPAEQTELLAMWDNGGVSHHRLTVKFLNNIFQRFQPPQPVAPNNPAASKIMSTSGKRNWYDTVDGAKSA